MKKKLLLHACCAPCASVAIERLSPEYALTVFYFNPNIQPEDEYQRRFEQFNKLRQHNSFELLTGEYCPQDWGRIIAGYEQEPEKGRRCGLCFNYRLQRTAALAGLLDFQIFATTLTVSPLKNAVEINTLGMTAAKDNHLTYLGSNFKRNAGYQRSLELSKKYGLYRQNYCGCIYSQKGKA